MPKSCACCAPLVGTRCPRRHLGGSTKMLGTRFMRWWQTAWRVMRRVCGWRTRGGDCWHCRVYYTQHLCLCACLVPGRANPAWLTGRCRWDGFPYCWYYQHFLIRHCLKNRRRLPSDGRVLELLFLNYWLLSCTWVVLVMRAGPKTNSLVIALAIGVMASALTLSFWYADWPSYASPIKAASTLDASGNSAVKSR